MYQAKVKAAHHEAVFPRPTKEIVDRMPCYHHQQLSRGFAFKHSLPFQSVLRTTPPSSETTRRRWSFDLETFAGVPLPVIASCNDDACGAPAAVAADRENRRKLSRSLEFSKETAAVDRNPHVHIPRGRVFPLAIEFHAKVEFINLSDRFLILSIDSWTFSDRA